jgi:hypothetical protein
MLRDHVPLRDTLNCDGCGRVEVLHVGRVCDWNVGPEPLLLGRTAAGDRLGHFELCICTGCGQVDWLVVVERPLDPLPELGLVGDIRHGPCQACSSPLRWKLGPVRELGAGYDDPVAMLHYSPPTGATGPRGVEFEICFCEGCGQASWWSLPARPSAPSRTQTGDHLEPVGEPVVCRGCHGLTEPLVRARDLSRCGGWIDRHVAYDASGLNPRTWGHLEVACCRRCGLVSWSARDIDGLPEGPATQVERLRHPRRGVNHPYR